MQHGAVIIKAAALMKFVAPALPFMRLRRVELERRARQRALRAALHGTPQNV